MVPTEQGIMGCVAGLTGKVLLSTLKNKKLWNCRMLWIWTDNLLREELCLKKNWKQIYKPGKCIFSLLPFLS